MKGKAAAPVPFAARLLGVVLLALGAAGLVGAALRFHLAVPRADLVAARQTPVVVRVNTFRRNDLLAKFVEHYELCTRVREITVVWSDVERPPPKWLEKRARVTGHRARVVVERHEVDSLNNRFKPLSPVETPAVFSVDDDLFVTCEALASLVDVWHSAPTQMVGVAPRLISHRDSTYRYLRWWHVWWNGKYNVVLTKAAVFHRDYLTAYSLKDDATMSAVRAHVDVHRNCEDLGMSFVVANATGSPPIWVREKYVDYGESWGAHAGISGGSGHVETRADCVAHFAKLFGRMPLATATHKVVDAELQWWW